VIREFIYASNFSFCDELQIGIIIFAHDIFVVVTIILPVNVNQIYFVYTSYVLQSVLCWNNDGGVELFGLIFFFFESTETFYHAVTRNRIMIYRFFIFSS